MKIVFFGASVTQQGEEHGYYPRLVKRLRSSYKTLETRRFAFGNCHFANMGHFALSRVIAEKPDICILDWLSTSHPPTKDEYKVLLEILTINNIVPVTAIFPRKDKIMSSVFSWIKDIGWYYIDIGEQPGFQPDIFLRDSVHTNKDGAEFYSRTLYMYIERLTESVNSSESLRQNPEIPRDTSIYADFSYKYNQHNTRIDLRESKPIFSNTTSGAIHLVIIATKGPYAPVVKVDFNAEPSQASNICKSLEFDLFDRWCYYDRTTLAFTLDVQPFTTAYLSISDAIPNYRRAPKLVSDSPVNEFYPHRHLLVNSIYIQDLTLDSIFPLKED